jgi:hypothetical protein
MGSKAVKVIVDKQKLDALVRLGCPAETIIAALCGKKARCNQLDFQDDFQVDFVNEILSSFCTEKSFSNWGGTRTGSGRPRKSKNNQVDFQVDNQVDFQVDFGASMYSSSNLENNINNISTTRARKSSFVAPTLDDVLSYAATQSSCAGCGGFACTPRVAEEFWSYYSGLGWVLPNDAQTPIRDWKPFLRKWANQPNRFRSASATRDPDDLPI